VRRLALNQRLRRHENRAEREADGEGRRERRRDVRHGAQQQHAGADADHPDRTSRYPSFAFADDLRARASRRRAADEPERARARVQRIAHVDRDQRPETADHEQAGRHREDEEQDGGVVDDELPAGHHVGPDPVDRLLDGSAGGRSDAGRLITTEAIRLADTKLITSMA
jgi:hypothetical protein